MPTAVTSAQAEPADARVGAPARRRGSAPRSPAPPAAISSPVSEPDHRVQRRRGREHAAPLGRLDGRRHRAHGRRRRRCCAAPAGSRPARPPARRRPARPPTAGGPAASRSRAAPAGPLAWATCCSERTGSEQAGLARPRRTLVGLRNPGGTHGLRPYARAVPARTLRRGAAATLLTDPHADSQPARAASPPPRRRPTSRTRDILGVPVAMVDYDRAIAGDGPAGRARASAATSAPRRCTPLMVAQDDPEMLAALRGATLVVPDGMPPWSGRPTCSASALERPRLRPRADAALQRALRRARPPRLALRRPRPGLAGAAGAGAAPAPPGHPDRGRLLAAVPAAHAAEEEAAVVDADQRGAGPTCSGSASACPSRRSGWRACATASTCR